MDRETQRRLAKLEALEAGGVDNWSGYDFAMEGYQAIIEHEKKAESLIDDIFAEIHEYIEQPAGYGAGYGIKSKGYELAVEMLLAKVEKFK